MRLAQEGADIIACDVCAPVDTMLYKPATVDELDATVAAVEAEDRRILARTADIRDLPALEALVADGVGDFGRLDIVVANAGGNERRAFVGDHPGAVGGDHRRQPDRNVEHH